MPMQGERHKPAKNRAARRRDHGLPAQRGNWIGGFHLPPPHSAQHPHRTPLQHAAFADALEHLLRGTRGSRQKAAIHGVVPAPAAHADVK